MVAGYHLNLIVSSPAHSLYNLFEQKRGLVIIKVTAITEMYVAVSVGWMSKGYLSDVAKMVAIH